MLISSLLHDEVPARSRSFEHTNVRHVPNVQLPISEASLKEPIISTTMPPSLLNLPEELVLEILSYLGPSSILGLTRVSKSLNVVIRANERRLALDMVDSRYPLLQACFPLPDPWCPA
jgi:hypothetical protein